MNDRKGCPHLENIEEESISQTIANKFNVAVLHINKKQRKILSEMLTLNTLSYEKYTPDGVEKMLMKDTIDIFKRWLIDENTATSGTRIIVIE